MRSGLGSFRGTCSPRARSFSAGSPVSTRLRQRTSELTARGPDLLTTLQAKWYAPTTSISHRSVSTFYTTSMFARSQTRLLVRPPGVQFGKFQDRDRDDFYTVLDFSDDAALETLLGADLVPKQAPTLPLALAPRSDAGLALAPRPDAGLALAPRSGRWTRARTSAGRWARAQPDRVGGTACASCGPSAIPTAGGTGSVSQLEQESSAHAVSAPLRIWKNPDDVRDRAGAPLVGQATGAHPREFVGAA